MLTRQEALARALGIAALNVIAVTHFIDLSHKLEEEVFYMAALFGLLIAASIALAVLLLRVDTRSADAAWAAGALLSAGALGGYAVTRVVAFPQMGDHVGDWTSLVGVASVLAEATFVALAVYAIRSVGVAPSARRSRRPATVSAAPLAAVLVGLALVAGGTAGAPNALAHGGEDDEKEGAAPALVESSPSGTAAGAPVVGSSASGHGGPTIPGVLKDGSILAGLAFSLAAAASLRRRVEPAS